MKLHLIDGNNVLRRNFETSGAAWAIQSYIQACIGSSINGTLVWVWDGANAKGGWTPRTWLRTKGNSIEGGTSEVQLNIIAKNILGLG